MRKREACCGREQFPVRYNKAVRASSIRRRMELRGLCVPARANRRGAWTGPPRSILITRAKNLYDQKTPKGHQNFTLGKYKPSRRVLINRDCSAVAGRRKRCVWIGAESSGDLLPPSPPADRPPPAKIRPG